MRDKLEKIIFLGHYLAASRSEDEIFEMAMLISRDVLGYDHGIFRILEGEKLISKKWFGFPQEAADLVITLGEGITGVAVERGESILVSDTRADERFLAGVSDCRSALCAPIKYDNRPVGAINVESDKSDFFSRSDLQLLEALGSQIASALETRRLRDELIRSEKLSILGQMAASILHDIRNDIHQLKISSYLLSKGNINQERADKVAGIVTKAGDNIYGLIEDIFDFVRKGETQIAISPTPLAPLLESVLEQVRGFAKKNIAICLNGVTTVTVPLDERRFRRVLLNLCRNGVEAMPTAGTLSLTVTQENDGPIALSISDTGCGIPPDYIEKMWEPLNTSGKKNGTGLGMAIVRQIVDEHHFSIDVTSTPDDGTTFTITMTAVDQCPYST